MGVNFAILDKTRRFLYKTALLTNELILSGVFHNSFTKPVG